MVKRHTSVNLNFRFIILKEALSIPNKINDVRKFLGKFDELLLKGGGGGGGWRVEMVCQHALPGTATSPAKAPCRLLRGFL